MADNSQIEEGVFPTDRIEGVQPLGADQKKMPPSTSFQSFMQPTAAQGQQVTEMPSPFELPRDGRTEAISGKPTIDSVLAQINVARKSTNEAHAHLNTPNLKLTKAQRYLLNNKLSDAKAHINSATGKVGVEPPTPKTVAASANPVIKFLNILTDGQYQLQAAKEHLEQMKQEGTTMSAPDLLLMQVKLGKAQTEIEYSSVLLSKAVDATKQLYGTQI